MVLTRWLARRLPGSPFLSKHREGYSSDPAGVTASFQRGSLDMTLADGSVGKSLAGSDHPLHTMSGIPIKMAGATWLKKRPNHQPTRPIRVHPTPQIRRMYSGLPWPTGQLRAYRSNNRCFNAGGSNPALFLAECHFSSRTCRFDTSSPGAVR